jgi:hypothetical protein
MSGFNGTLCEHNIDDCPASIGTAYECQNDGLCVDGVNNNTCDCSTTGYDGFYCTDEVDECAGLVHCGNNGTCTNTIGSFDCNCTGTGFEGATCETNIDDCIVNPCLNGGTCIDDVNSFLCECVIGANGTLCGSTNHLFVSASESIDTSDDDLSTGAIVGISIGAVVGAGLAVVAAIFTYKKLTSTPDIAFTPF